MRPGVVIALVLPAALAAGCSSGSDKQVQQPLAPAVAWTSTTPPQFAERKPVERACRASELKVPAQVKFVPRLQGGIALAVVRNTGSRTCRLTGRPRVTFVKNGGPVQVDRPTATTPSNFPDVTYPQSSLLALRPGESAALTVSWDNWCDLVVKGQPHVPPSALRITLPAGRGVLDADYNAVPPCIDPSAPSTIGVSVFQASLIPSGRPWTKSLLVASVPRQPVHAKRGAILHYRVVLKNRFGGTVRFGACPAYIQQLAPRGQIEAFDLNCAAAHPIRPGKSLAFAMRLRVPKHAPLGPNGLFWELDPFGGRGPQVHARVVVER